MRHVIDARWATKRRVLRVGHPRWFRGWACWSRCDGGRDEYEPHSASDSTRLATVNAPGLVSAGLAASEPILERHADVALSLIDAPLILVTLLTAEEQ